jgi:hypothetical protein
MWYVAGDDDQSIFHWAGADSDTFQDMHTEEVEILDQSYRCSIEIHKVAMTIASRISKRLPKEYKPTQSKGEVSNVGYIKAVDFSEKTFVLFRNHYRGQELSNQLKEDGVPFVGHGSPLLDPNVRVALDVWMKLHTEGKVEPSLLKKCFKYLSQSKVTDTVRQGISDKKMMTIDQVFKCRPKRHEWTRFMENIPGKDIIEMSIRRYGIDTTINPNVELLSMHQSKGREAHTVVLDTEMSRATWEGMLTNPDDEHRTQYVAITRAKEKAFILLPDGVLSYRI